MTNLIVSSHPPTEEQQAILDAGANRTESVMVNAYAGTGKTTTMVMLSKVFPASEPVMALAFNKTIKDTLEKVLPSHFSVKTFNGVGHSAFGKALGKGLRLDDRKIGRLVTSYFKELNFQASTEDWATVKDMVNQAYKLGLVPAEFSHVKGLIPDDDDSWKIICLELGVESSYIAAARAVLLASVKESLSGTISFDDQIYMSVLFGGLFPKFQKLIVDEAQDLSPLNHLQIRKISSDPKARLFVVGDRKQAIYAFRGADSASMDRLKNLKKDWIELPLYTTFRCPKVIVQRAQAHAPGYKAYEKNLLGTVARLPRQTLTKAEAEALTLEGKPLPSWKWSEVAALAAGKDIAVLCRNNAPLLSMAFKLIRRGIGCKMMGREIGKGLITLAKKILPSGELSLSECVSMIDHWRHLEVAKAEALNQESKVDGIHDRAECILAVCQHANPKTSSELFSAIDDLFSRESGQVTLASGHKSKGLEWDTVVHLDPWRVPSRWAKSEAELQQEANLRYVIETRPKATLILADLETFE